MATQSERRTSTIEALLDAARQTFVEDGFDATSVDDVARRVGLSKGAVYHHYPSKLGLFRAVFEAVELEIQERVIRRAAKVTDPVERIIAGNDAFLEAAMDPEVARIALMQAPAVLGWTEFREIDERYFLGLLRQALSEAMSEKVGSEQATLRARMIFGGLCELAVAIATSLHPKRTLQLAKVESRRAVRSLIPVPVSPRAIQPTGRPPGPTKK